MSSRVGLDCKTYRNTGTYGVPVWNEITIIVDATLALARGKAAGPSRTSRFRQHLPTLVDAPITFNIVADPAIDDYDVLKDSLVAATPTAIDIAFANGAIATSGTRYWRADMYVFGWSQGQPLEDVETIDVQLDMAMSSNTPAYTTVA